MPPQQQQQPQGNSLKMYLDLSGRGGLGPRWFGDEGDSTSQYPQYRYIGDIDQNTPTFGASTASELAAGVYNPMRRYGYLAPAQNSFVNVVETDATYNFTNEIRSTIYDVVEGNWYAAENGNLLWGGQVGTASATSLRNSTASLFPGTNCVITDLEVYEINGSRQLFISYRNIDTGGDIAIATMSTGGAFSTFNQTWLSTTAATPFHIGATTGTIQVNDQFMVVADNGFMYVGDGNTLHKIDGTVATGGVNGTGTKNVLIAPTSYKFLDGVDYKGALWLAVEDSPPGISLYDSAYVRPGNTCGVYVWDRQQTIVNMTDYIPVRGVVSIKKIYITQDGVLRIICLTSKMTTQIREYDGNTFISVEELPLGAIPSFRDSVSVPGNVVYWLGKDGRMYSHGKTEVGEQDGLFVVGDFTGLLDQTPSNCNMGAILYLNDGNEAAGVISGFFFSIRTSTPLFLNKFWYMNARNGTPHAGNVYTLVKYFPQPVKVNYVRVYHNAGATSGTTSQGTLNVFLNQATAASKSFDISRDDIAKGWKYCPINQGLKNAVVAIQFSFVWNTGIVTEDITDWMLRALEVDYVPLEKLM